uniref:Uncharacterized protein n=1 Tax=Triticum urartu TaxID=4572 RepID=A0A8R7PUP4_TRIUA
MGVPLLVSDCHKEVRAVGGEATAATMTMRTVFSKRCSPNVALNYVFAWLATFSYEARMQNQNCHVLGVVLDYSLLLCGSVLPLHSYIVFCDVILLVVGSSMRAPSEVCSLG